MKKNNIPSSQHTISDAQALHFKLHSAGAYGKIATSRIHKNNNNNFQENIQNKKGL